MIRVLLADDHRIVRGGLARIVEESGDIEVVAEAADGREAIQQVHRTQPGCGGRGYFHARPGRSGSHQPASA